MTRFTLDIITVIFNIPEGKVMTYGSIADLAGSPRSARQVVRILHTMTEKYGLPWHRVINARGEIGLSQSQGGQIQAERLKSEGVLVKGNQLDLKTYFAQDYYLEVKGLGLESLTKPIPIK